MGAPITLCLFSGFDAERDKKLIRYFEPDNIIIVCQFDSIYENHREDAAKIKKAFDRNEEIKWLEIDFKDSSYIILKQLRKIVTKFDKSNIIMSSHGPKLSAITIYKYFVHHPKVSLAYTPSLDVNIKYSEGWLDTKEEELRFTK